MLGKKLAIAYEIRVSASIVDWGVLAVTEEG
jgi:hypothetical protein